MSIGGQPVPTGVPGQVSPYGQQGRPTNSLAITAFSCGIAQILFWPFATIPAIICGIRALGQIRTTGEDGSGMAKVGLTLGLIGLAIEVAVVIVLIMVL
jgi:hypothetical protein